MSSPTGKLPSCTSDSMPRFVYVCVPLNRTPPVASGAVDGDVVVRGYLGNSVLQRFKLTGKAALITGVSQYLPHTMRRRPANRHLRL